eukprot:scaffold19220_cov180-Amphora_coffeaeformis.AAC.7
MDERQRVAPGRHPHEAAANEFYQYNTVLSPSTLFCVVLLLLVPYHNRPPLHCHCPDYLTPLKPLYERKDVTREVTSRILQVFGPSGSGKSCATCGWVESICQKLNVKAVWLSCSTQAGKSWSIQQNQGVGKLEATQQFVPKQAADSLGIAVIEVSSEGVRFHEGDSSRIMKPEHVVPSWTLEEYTAACSDEKFWAAYLAKFPRASVADNLARRERMAERKVCCCWTLSSVYVQACSSTGENEYRW